MHRNSNIKFTIIANYYMFRHRNCILTENNKSSTPIQVLTAYAGSVKILKHHKSKIYTFDQHEPTIITKWQKYSQNTTIFIFLANDQRDEQIFFYVFISIYLFISYEWVDHIAVYNYMFRPLSTIVSLYYFLL